MAKRWLHFSKRLPNIGLRKSANAHIFFVSHNGASAMPAWIIPVVFCQRFGGSYKQLSGVVLT